jgi:cobalt-precorrin 5A hydrolase
MSKGNGMSTGMNMNMSMSIAVISITKHGVEIALRIKNGIDRYYRFYRCDIYAQDKFRAYYNDDNDNSSYNSINWYNEPTTALIARLFNSYDALICIFSLGAVVRLIAPHIRDKRSDPAVLVIDDRARYVISALSGHLGGANELAKEVAGILDATPVITTAADVNETIAVDLLGREFNWVIDDSTYSNVTMLSAAMVNEEPIGVYQDAGEVSWMQRLPSNVKSFRSLEELLASGHKALIITDRLIDKDDRYSEMLKRSVVYRPKSLVVGVGLHYDTSKEEIASAIESVFSDNMLSTCSIRNIATLKRSIEVKGLRDYSNENNIQVVYYTKEELADVRVPNPSEMVNRYEGIYSVAEAAALLSSKGVLIVEKRKFPPNLTIAVARIKGEHHA